MADEEQQQTDVSAIDDIGAAGDAVRSAVEDFESAGGQEPGQQLGGGEPPAQEPAPEGPTIEDLPAPEPEPWYTQNADGSFSAFGKYHAASVDELSAQVAQAYDNARTLIRQGRHKTGDLTDEDLANLGLDPSEIAVPEEEPEPEDEGFRRPALQAADMPIGDDPQTVEELYAIANDFENAGPYRAAMFALGNPDAVRPGTKLFVDTINHWAVNDPVSFAAFQAQAQQAQFEERLNQHLEEVRAESRPAIEAEQRRMGAAVLAQVRGDIEDFEAYEAKIHQHMADGGEPFTEWFDSLTPDQQVDALTGIYAEIRGREYVEARRAHRNGQQVEPIRQATAADQATGRAATGAATTARAAGGKIAATTETAPSEEPDGGAGEDDELYARTLQGAQKAKSEI